MNVLREILQWSTARPEWQRDALRRLVTQPQIEESDVSELTTVCKATHGLAERVPTAPLQSQDIRSRRAQHSAVTLGSITHHSGVNALAKNQKLECQGRSKNRPRWRSKTGPLLIVGRVG